MSTKDDGAPAPGSDHIEVLRKYFGHSQFRPMQWKIIHSIIKERRDNCVIMATGYGKSLCYQYPAVYCKGVAVVISPLISLMQDQVLSLQVANIPACFLGSAQTAKTTVLNSIMNGEYRVVYLTPEWCTTDYGKDILIKISKNLSLTLVAIDEAHCVSQWGFDFRKSYRKLGELRKLLSDVPFLCVTATATPRVRCDIVASLNLRNANMIITSFDRPNLYLSVNLKGDDIVNDFLKVLERVENKLKFPGPTIIYCPTKKATEKVAYALNGIGVQAGIYHADLPQKTRKEVHEQFVKDILPVVVATIAFGMGIDKPDVRLVIHYGAPKDFEAYYQEIGRAGRDGLPSSCQVFYTPTDFSISRHFLSSLTGVFREHREKMVRLMELYLETKECRRKVLLSHFDQKEANELQAKDHCCDNCTMNAQSHLFRRATTPEVDIKPDAKILLKAVKVLEGRFGLGVPIALIRGKPHQRLKDFHQKLEAYGSGKDNSEVWWKAIGRLLVRENLLNEYSSSFTGSTWGKKQFPMTLTRITQSGENFLAAPDDDTTVKLVPTPEILSLVKKKAKIITAKPGEWQNMSRITCLSQTIEASQSPTQNTVSEEELQLQTKLYLALLEVRSQIAHDNDCMPYMIANNKTLVELAKIRPTNKFELSKVEGFGDVKIQKFGDAILSAIHRFCTQNKTDNRLKVEDLHDKFRKPTEVYKIKHVPDNKDNNKNTQNIVLDSSDNDNLWGNDDDSFLENIPMDDGTKIVKSNAKGDCNEWENDVWDDELEKSISKAETAALSSPEIYCANKKKIMYENDSDTYSDLENSCEKHKSLIKVQSKSLSSYKSSVLNCSKSSESVVANNKRKIVYEDSDDNSQRSVKTKMPKWLTKPDVKQQIKRKMKMNSLFKI